MALGFTLVSALLVVILRWVIQINLPYISEFLAKVLTLTEYYAQHKP
ncbi:MAG: DUF5665 domain-containing protein [Clostridiales bacterium]|nr:DUF5665 domain-containing protein [Clostridiales bacterium]